MSKSKITITGITAAILVVLALGLFLFTRESKDQPPLEPSRETATSLNLGITYLAVTPRLSAYYDLGVDSGALVTEVIPDSLADRAGVEVGDVILSFNGARVEEEARLLGMMIACPAGNRIALNVWRGKSSRMIEFIHTPRGNGMHQ